MGVGVVRYLRLYWKSIFTIIYPLILLPVFLFNNVPEMRCFYVVLLMAGFWMLEVLPLAITSLIPMVLFPLMGILDSEKTSVCYLKETNMMFISGLIIAIAVEHCNLHTRVSLYVIKMVGCSPRRLNFGLVTVTMLVSMWISNTAATAMMIPIIEATLAELERQGVGEVYEPTPEVEEPLNVDKETKKTPAEEARRPTKATMCYYISTAYAANIGGLGTIVGSGTNLTFKGLFESLYPNSPGVEFASWMIINIPMMLLMMLFTLLWLQIWFMGLFRPNSKDAKRIKVGPQGQSVALKLIQEKIDGLGPMSFHEICVAICFGLAIVLWFFRKPEFITGWAELVTHLKVKDATAGFIVVLFLFILPAKPSCLFACSKDESKRPLTASQPLLTWRIVQQKLPWGLIFLLGGGFALAAGSDQSGMSKMLAHYLNGISSLPPFALMVISSLFGILLTQFSSNVAVANVLLPVLAAIANSVKIHPMYLMLPTAIGCSFAYCMPVSTPPNAIAAAPASIPTKEMAKAGLGTVVVSCLVLYSVYPFLGSALYDFGTFPAWAGELT